MGHLKWLLEKKWLLFTCLLSLLRMAAFELWPPFPRYGMKVVNVIPEGSEELRSSGLVLLIWGGFFVVFFFIQLKKLTVFPSVFSLLAIITKRNFKFLLLWTFLPVSPLVQFWPAQSLKYWLWESVYSSSSFCPCLVINTMMCFPLPLWLQA